MIRTYLGVVDFLILPNQKSRRHWEGPRRLAVERWQIVAQSLVNINDVVRQHMTNSESLCCDVPIVAEYRNVKHIVSYEVSVSAKYLRGNCDEICAQFTDYRRRLFERRKL